jgi:2'-5' RNA ligase
VHLHVAFVPPDPVVDALTAIVAVSSEPPPEIPPSREPGRHSMLARRPTPPPVGGGRPLLDVVSTSRMLVPITDIGYVAPGDSGRLAKAMDEVGAASPRPTVRVAGGDALVDPEDRSVWAVLAGDEEQLTALRTLAGAVVAGLEPLGFFCDRRQYRPRIPLATINEQTTVDGLEQVLAQLASYDEAWEVDRFVLFERSGRQTSTVWRSVPVGG